MSYSSAPNPIVYEKFRSFLIILIIISSHAVSAQYSGYSKEEKDNWGKGKVILRSGEEYEGDINYDFVEDLLRIKFSNSEKIFLANNVKYFLFFADSIPQVFYSLPFDIKNRGMAIPTFFYVIYQNSHYMLLSKTLHENLIAGFSSMGTQGLVGPSGPYERVNQIIFLANKDGNITPCLKREINIFNKPQVGSGSLAAHQLKKYSIINKQDIKDFFGRNYKQFQKRIKEKDLNFKKLEDLKEALDFRE